MTQATFQPNNIKFYQASGFKPVCRVNLDPRDSTLWVYSNINQSLMFSEHRSWVYAITINNIILKWGETGNPLGILGRMNYDKEIEERQPKTGTRSRLGRYRKGCGTDDRIRRELFDRVSNKKNKVEFWALPCAVSYTPITLGTRIVEVKSATHKDIEHILLDEYRTHYGCWPELNTGRC